MKELTPQEVFQVAGGLPDLAALEELSYREGAPALVQGQPPASGASQPPCNES